MPSERRSNVWIVVLVVVLIIFFAMILVPLIFLFVPADFKQGNVAIIEIRGVITEDGDYSFGQDTAASSDIVQFIHDADEDPLIKAIVVDINSPGGSAVASDEIASALKSTEKPTVALIHEIGTSGAYWIASAADTIIANRMSITGSIGVIASYLEFSQLMGDYGISYQRFVGGNYKDLGTPFKSPTDAERKLFQSKIDKIHGSFIDEIAKNRKLSESQVRQLATGEFFLGSEAKERGLVDMLGNQQTLEEYLEQAGIAEIEFVWYSHEPTFLEALAGLANEQFFFMGKGIGNAFVERASGAPIIV
ncbi:signal peptide peptidase SppA [Candidatus Woesearchaeota archaeon]|nr:signal peptide peptidase SppA [Candidatus Woesearchaeota archaeon]